MSYWRLILTVFLTSCVYAASAFAQADTDTMTAVPTRPTFTNATDTVPEGEAQVEYGAVWQNFVSHGHGRSFNGTYTIGLGRRADLRVSSDHVLLSNVGDVREYGMGDVWVGARFRFNQQTSAVPSFGLLYQVKVPTSDPNRNLGTGYVDHSVALLLSKDLGRMRVDSNLVQFAVGTAAGWRSSTLGSIVVSRPLRGGLGGLLEAYGGRAADGSGAASLLTALTYRWSPRLVCDFGVEYGLTQAVPRNRFVTGVSYSLARLWRRKQEPAAIVRH